MRASGGVSKMPPALRMSQHHISRYLSQPTQTEFWIVKFRFKRLYQNYIRLYMLIIVYIIVYICLFYSLRTSNILGAHTPSHTRTPYEESSLLSSAKSHGRSSTHRRSRLKQGQGLGCLDSFWVAYGLKPTRLTISITIRASVTTP